MVQFSLINVLIKKTSENTKNNILDVRHINEHHIVGVVSIHICWVAIGQSVQTNEWCQTIG